MESSIVADDPYFHKIKEIEQAIIKKIRKPNPTVECKVSYEDVRIMDLLGMVNYEWVLQQTEERSREMGLHIELRNIKSELKEIKYITSENNRFIKDIHKDLHAAYFGLEDDIAHISGQFFDHEQEAKSFYKKIEKRLTAEEKTEIGHWADGKNKHKLKAVLNLIFIKYEREMEIADFKIPRTWKEFKRWFIKA